MEGSETKAHFPGNLGVDTVVDATNPPADDSKCSPIYPVEGDQQFPENTSKEEHAEIVGIEALSITSADEVASVPDSNDSRPDLPKLTSVDSVTSQTELVPSPQKSELPVAKNHVAGPWDSWTPQQRKWILFLVSLPAFLVPITTTIYLPSIPVITVDLHATSVQIGATISTYTAVLGITPLIWGPLSDAKGRRIVLIFSTLAYFVTCILCGFSSSVTELIVFRTLQAIGVSASIVVGSGAVIDTHPPEKRGVAMGIFGIAPLIGPVIGPVLGGFIASGAGWRSIFFVLAGLAGAAFLLVSFGLPETHPKMIVKREAAKRLKESAGAATEQPQAAPASPQAPQKQRNLLYPLRFLLNRRVLVLAIQSGCIFGGMYILIALLPVLLSDTYGLNTIQIGLAYLPFGFGTLCGTVLGGKITDKGARLVRENPDKHKFEGRLIGSITVAFLFAAFYTGLGYSVGTSLHIPLILTFFFGASVTLNRPGIQTYTIEISPRDTSSISACVLFVNFVCSTIGTQTATIGVHAIGYGATFLIVAMITIAANIPTIMLFFRHHWFWSPPKQGGSAPPKQAEMQEVKK